RVNGSYIVSARRAGKNERCLAGVRSIKETRERFRRQNGRRSQANRRHKRRWRDYRRGTLARAHRSALWRAPELRRQTGRLSARLLRGFETRTRRCFERVCGAGRKRFAGAKRRPQSQRTIDHLATTREGRG